MTQTNIILTSICMVCVGGLIYAYRRWMCTAKKLDKAYSEINDYLNDQNVTDSHYTIVKIGKCRGVFRSTVYNEQIGESVIKWFDTDDESFNQREAEELCDKLNENDYH